MTNSAHYPSLNLCKELTEIWFPVTEKYLEALPNWTINTINDTISTKLSTDEYFPEYRCPSIGEMLDLMPSEVGVKWVQYSLTVTKSKVLEDELWVSAYTVAYCSLSWPDDYIFFEQMSMKMLPDALAQMLLWLHQEGHISFKDQ